MAASGYDHPLKTRRQKSLHLQGTKWLGDKKVPPPGHKRSKPALPKGKVPEKGKRVSSPPKGVLLLPFSTKKYLTFKFLLLCFSNPFLSRLIHNNVSLLSRRTLLKINIFVIFTCWELFLSSFNRAIARQDHTPFLTYLKPNLSLKIKAHCQML
jgi:hypothetical protein